MRGIRTLLALAFTSLAALLAAPAWGADATITTQGNQGGWIVENGHTYGLITATLGKTKAPYVCLYTPGSFTPIAVTAINGETHIQVPKAGSKTAVYSLTLKELQDILAKAEAEKGPVTKLVASGGPERDNTGRIIGSGGPPDEPWVDPKYRDDGRHPSLYQPAPSVQTFTVDDGFGRYSSCGPGGCGVSNSCQPSLTQNCGNGNCQSAGNCACGPNCNCGPGGQCGTQFSRGGYTTYIYGSNACGSGACGSGGYGAGPDGEAIRPVLGAPVRLWRAGVERRQGRRAGRAGDGRQEARQSRRSGGC